MDAAQQLNYYTIDDINNLPDGQRAELLDGEMYMMAAPGLIHQRLVKEFTYQIETYIRHKNRDCEVFPAPFAVFLDSDHDTYVEPDISVVCNKNKLTEKGCQGAPDWIIEIVSSSSRTMDYYRKLIKYQSAGVKEYWIVDYEKNHILVYNFEHTEVSDYTFSDSIKAGIYPDFELNFSDILLK